jgi:hypothetical protein
MAGVRLHLDRGRGRVKTAWLRVALSAHKGARVQAAGCCRCEAGESDD